MKISYLILVLIVLTSCRQFENTKTREMKIESKNTELAKLQLKDTTINFLWRDMKYDSVLNSSINSIFINKDYLNSITEPEKASIGYVATFIGNECWWDDKANHDRSNLDCKIITALGLGYQCSNKHLGFLRKWFSTDKQVLSDLEKSNCPTTPYTATIQNSFDEIKLTIKKDSILVFYKVSGVNMRKQESWEWTETDYFILKNNNLKLIKKDKSEVRDKKKLELKENKSSHITNTQDQEKPKTEQEIISDIREKFGAINYNINSYKKVKKDLSGESTEGGELEGYFKNVELKKIITSYYGEMGKLIEEYYLWNDQLFFVFTQAYSYNMPMYMEDSKVIKINENRYYFYNDKLIRWLDSQKEKVIKSNFAKKEIEILQKTKKLKEKLK
ncbi:hypothetical protein [Aquimarina algiphila]|uniref:hypothetical protein n=1 Tax=Aquimarina algiphila TaxID=2047982 RepID=UPI00232B8B3F|nr:hypothetical protein [Aquimarina algiphila]